MQQVIALTGGGTGGHLSIAKSLGLACRAAGLTTLYIGGTRGQDRQWFEGKQDFDHTAFLDSKPVVNQKGIDKLKASIANLQQALEARRLMKKLNAKACISVGGFCAASGSVGALLAGLPLFIHEQNAQAGLLNSVLKPFCKNFFSSFNFKGGTLTAYPVHPLFFQKQRKREIIESILFLGGSQGAKAINDLALALAPGLRAKNIKIIHQTGKNDYQRILQCYEDIGISPGSYEKNGEENGVLVFDFSQDLATFMEKSDFCISRAGASSLWELASIGLPSLFVPYPYAAKNHQYFNAKFLSDKGLAMLYTQEELASLDKDLLLEKILSFPLGQASEGLIDCARPGGADEIIKKILQSIGGTNA